MRKRHGCRGISVGTVVMLAAAALVLVTMLRVLTSLQHGADLKNLQASNILELSDDLAVGVMDIPDGMSLSQAYTQQTMQVTSAPLHPEATAAPVVTATPTPTATPYAGGSFVLTAGGSFYIESDIRQSCYYRESKKYDLDELVSLIAPDIIGDLCITTLENVVMDSDKYTNLVAPDAAMSMLRAAGFDTVATGFSKTMEKGLDGIEQTIRSAQLHGLRTVGAYTSDNARASAVQYMTINGVKICLLHYTHESILTSAAKQNRTSVGSWAQSLTTEAVEDVTTAREKGAQIVIVSLNWSKKEATAVTKKQAELAQALADAGADVILGSGAQNILPIEWLEGHRANGQIASVLCCYDLGSLISDSRSNNGVTGMLLHITISVDAAGRPTLGDATYTPTYIWHYQQDKVDHYRIVNSSQPAPDGMDAAQERSKDNALERVPKKIKNDKITLHTR